MADADAPAAGADESRPLQPAQRHGHAGTMDAEHGGQKPLRDEKVVGAHLVTHLQEGARAPLAQGMQRVAGGELRHLDEPHHTVGRHEAAQAGQGRQRRLELHRLHCPRLPGHLRHRDERLHLHPHRHPQPEEAVTTDGGHLDLATVAQHHQLRDEGRLREVNVSDTRAQPVQLLPVRQLQQGQLGKHLGALGWRQAVEDPVAGWRHRCLVVTGDGHRSTSRSGWGSRASSRPRTARHRA